MPVAIVTGDLPAAGEADKLLADRPDVIFHLAAIVSGEAEADFEKGYRINLDGTRALLEAVRQIGDGYRPTLVFTSSVAAFGAPFPAAIPEPAMGPGAARAPAGVSRVPSACMRVDQRSGGAPPRSSLHTSIDVVPAVAACARYWLPGAAVSRGLP